MVFPPRSKTGVTSADVLQIKASLINLILLSCIASSLILDLGGNTIGDGVPGPITRLIQEKFDSEVKSRHENK